MHSKEYNLAETTTAKAHLGSVTMSHYKRQCSHAFATAATTVAAAAAAVVSLPPDRIIEDSVVGNDRNSSSCRSSAPPCDFFQSTNESHRLKNAMAGKKKLSHATSSFALLMRDRSQLLSRNKKYTQTRQFITQPTQISNCNISVNKPFPWMAPLSPWLRSTTKCDSTAMNNDSDPNPSLGVDYYYKLLDPSGVFRTSLVDSHAIFGALCGDGLIERYNVYRRVLLKYKQPNNDNGDDNDAGNITREITANSSSPRMHDELTVVDLKLGGRLNGHGGIVHGGIISLIFDEAMGWAHECLEEQISEENNALENDAKDITSPKSPSSIVVTANLNVDFRAPLFENSEVIVRVYHDGTVGRKIYFSAVLESLDGSVVFAEAKSLFIRVSKDRIKNA